MSVSLRILDETRIDIEEAQRRLGTEDTPIHFTTVYRLMKRGLKAPDGHRVTLEHVRVGGKLITSTEAIARFVAASNGVTLEAPSADEASPARRTKARQRELERVDVALAAAGIG